MQGWRSDPSPPPPIQQSQVPLSFTPPHPTPQQPPPTHPIPKAHKRLPRAEHFSPLNETKGQRSEIYLSPWQSNRCMCLPNLVMLTETACERCGPTPHTHTHHTHTDITSRVLPLLFSDQSQTPVCLHPSLGCFGFRPLFCVFTRTQRNPSAADQEAHRSQRTSNSEAERLMPTAANIGP